MSWTLTDRKKTYQILFFPILVLFLPPLPLRLLWLRGGVWGQSALVLLNGWQMTEKLEAFCSWQVRVCVCVQFLPLPSFFFFLPLLQMFLVSWFSVELSRLHNRRNLFAKSRVQKHTRGSSFSFRCVFSSETDLMLCFQIGGDGEEGEERFFLTKTSSPLLIIETDFDCLFGNSFSNSCNDND